MCHYVPNNEPFIFKKLLVMDYCSVCYSKCTRDPIFFRRSVLSGVRRTKRDETLPRRCASYSASCWPKTNKQTNANVLDMSISIYVLPPRSFYRGVCYYYHYYWPPLWSSGQSFWLQIQRSRVRSPALSSSGSGTGSTQPREVNWGATWMKEVAAPGLENRD